MDYSRAIYAGSFDPLTKGHIWVIERGLILFEHLVIAVGVNPKKITMFSPEERIEMIRDYLTKTGYDKFSTVISFENEFLVDVAGNTGCHHILRGIRNVNDFAYELEIKQFNDELNPAIDTVFVVPPHELVGRSSSIVKSCVGLKNWEHVVSNYTTEFVVQKLKERNEAK